MERKKRKTASKENKRIFQTALRQSLTFSYFIKKMGRLGLNPVGVGRGKSIQRNLPRY